MKSTFELTFAEWMTPTHVKCFVEHFNCIVKKRCCQTYIIEPKNLLDVFNMGLNASNINLIMQLYNEKNKVNTITQKQAGT